LPLGGVALKTLPNRLATPKIAAASAVLTTTSAPPKTLPLQIGPAGGVTYSWPTIGRYGARDDEVQIRRTAQLEHPSPEISSVREENARHVEKQVGGCPNRFARKFQTSKWPLGRAEITCGGNVLPSEFFSLDERFHARQIQRRDSGRLHQPLITNH
jgi:hypothetical protein